MNHTPLPWFTGFSRNGDLPDGTLIIAGDEKYRQPENFLSGNVICAVAPPYRTTEQDVANAEYIVEACNNYEKLAKQFADMKAYAEHLEIKFGVSRCICDNEVTHKSCPVHNPFNQGMRQ